MKLLKCSKLDTAIPPEKWKCFDGCPVCRMMKQAAEEGRGIDEEELEKAFVEAGEEIDAD